MEFHDIASLFPMMVGQDFKDLIEDIRTNGLHEPVWLYEGKILDGRNRWLACEDLGIKADFREYEGDDPVGFVVSLNLKRRHLTESQRAMVGAKVANMKQGERTDLEPSANWQKVSISEASDKLSVSERSICRAKNVQKDGVPELVQKVEQGEVKVSVASNIATLPRDEQAEVVARGEKEILEAAKAIRSQKAVKRREENERLRQDALAIQPPEGQYRCIVIDPPWPVTKLERDVRPNQVQELDYPVMSLDEIRETTIPAAEECLLYLWTTQRFLLEAHRILQAWDFKYLVMMVWHKPGGFQPVGLPQYNYELVLIGRRGGLGFNETRDFKLCFDAPRREHSRKPEAFYDLVRRVSPGPRLDMFSRERRDGFEQFGVETDAFLHH